MEAHTLAPRSFNRRCYTDARNRRVCDGLPVGAIVAMVLAIVIILPLGFMLACRSRRKSRSAATANASAHPSHDLPYDVESGNMQERLDSTAYLEKALADDVCPSSAPPPYPVPASPPIAGVRSTSQRSLTPPAVPAPVVMRGWPMGLIAASQRPPSHSGASNASTPTGSPRMGHRRQLSSTASNRQHHSRHGSTSASRSSRREPLSANAASASPFTDGAAAATQRNSQPA